MDKKPTKQNPTTFSPPKLGKDAFDYAFPKIKNEFAWDFLNSSLSNFSKSGYEYRSQQLKQDNNPYYNPYYNPTPNIPGFPPNRNKKKDNNINEQNQDVFLDRLINALSIK